MKFVLDTNIIIAAWNGLATITGRLETLPGEEVGVPAVVLAELYYGA